MAGPSHLEIIPLGGLGEFGMNLMVYRWGRDAILVDAGMMFPGAEHLGVDVIVPELSFLDECGTIHAVLLTHGHEDHIGALPHVLARHDVPVYATPYTRALARHRLAEYGMEDIRIETLPEPGCALELGPFRVETLCAAHSIPQARMLVLHTPLGVIVHTADFKLDPRPPGGETTDLAGLAEVGRRGVLALFSDSTNADRAGFTRAERSILPAIERHVAGCAGRVVITTFASHVRRLAELGHIAQRHGRKLCLVGGSLEHHASLAEGLDLLRFPAGLRVAPENLAEHPAQRQLIVAGGSQGEPTSALARIAVGRHRHVELDDGDLVLHSARTIPGNGKSIARMLDHVLRRGADVVTAEDDTIHASGHASREELLILIQLLRPRHLVPIHGEYRQLRAHAALAVEAGLDAEHVLLADSGDVIAVDTDSIARVDRVHVGQVLIDAGRREVDRGVLRDRRRVAGDGVVVPVVAVNRDGGVVDGSPEIVTRGFVAVDEDDLRRDARACIVASLRDATREERGDEGLMRARIRTDLQRFLRQRTRRQPLVIPVIVEL